MLEPAGIPSLMRILLPKRDRQRAHFQLKEAGLAACLVHALGRAPTSKDGARLLNWKTSAGSISGDLSLLACQVISARQQQQPGELSLSDVHGYFDKLSSATTRRKNTGVEGTHQTHHSPANEVDSAIDCSRTLWWAKP